MFALFTFCVFHLYTLLLHLWCCFKKTIRFTFITLHCALHCSGRHRELSNLCRHMQAGKTGGYKDLHQFSKISRIKKKPKTKHCGWRIIIKKTKTNQTTSEVFPGGTMADEDGARWFRIVTHDVAKVGYLLVVFSLFTTTLWVINW